jgi:cytochrome P450
MMEATLLLATIAQRYRFTLAPEAVVAPFFSITLRPKYGLPMQLHRRTGASQASATQTFQG